MDPSIIAAIIGAGATIVAVFVAWFLQREKQLVAKQLPAIASEENNATTEAAKNSSQRYRDEPSHYRFIKALPKLKAVVLENAQEGWDTGVAVDMREASYDVVDFLEYVWLRLAQFYPEKHWNGKRAEDYIRGYIQDRFSFHWSKLDLEGPGTGGTIVGVLTGGDVIADMEELIADTVSAMFMHNQDFDLEAWKAAWKG